MLLTRIYLAKSNQSMEADWGNNENRTGKFAVGFCSRRNWLEAKMGEECIEGDRRVRWKGRKWAVGIFPSLQCSAVSWGNAITLLSSVGFLLLALVQQRCLSWCLSRMLDLARKWLQFRVPQRITCVTCLLGSVERQPSFFISADILILPKDHPSQTSISDHFV